MFHSATEDRVGDDGECGSRVAGGADSPPDRKRRVQAQQRDGRDITELEGHRIEAAAAFEGGTARRGSPRRGQWLPLPKANHLCLLLLLLVARSAFAQTEGLEAIAKGRGRSAKSAGRG